MKDKPEVKNNEVTSLWRLAASYPHILVSNATGQGDRRAVLHIPNSILLTRDFQTSLHLFTQTPECKKANPDKTARKPTTSEYNFRITQNIGRIPDPETDFYLIKLNS